MTILPATPFSIDATGFYFESLEDYETKSKCTFDRFGNFVEEYEIQLIDSENTELFLACNINQANLHIWFDTIEIMQDCEKVCLFYQLTNGFDLMIALEKIDEPCITESSLRDAAEQLFDDCYLHSIPQSVQYYIDYEKFAHDCQIGGDMTEFTYNGTTYTCTNACEF
jgi:hypothetical protein